MKLADIFAGGMVLAANRPIRIFGEGRGRATVSLNGNYAEVVSDTDTVISRDICETDAIHPPTKDVLSKRIAEIVRKHYFN